MSKRSLFKEQIHYTLEIFRHLFADSEIIKSIDGIYEEELMRKIDLIPETAAEKVCKGTEIFKTIYKNIKFAELCEDFTSLPFPVNLKLDVYSLVIKGVDDKTRISNSKIRATVVTIIKYCKPILDCFTLALSDPTKYLKVIGDSDLSKYDSLI